MARFQIEKGERFALDKSEGLEKVQIDLNWKSGADLDASAPALVVLSPTATYTVPSESTVGVGC